MADWGETKRFWVSITVEDRQDGLVEGISYCGGCFADEAADYFTKAQSWVLKRDDEEKDNG